MDGLVQFLRRNAKLLFERSPRIRFSVETPCAFPQEDRMESRRNKALRFLRRSVLALSFSFVFSLALPMSFAQGKPGQENGDRESMLVWKTPFMGERYTVSGKGVFVVDLSLERFLASYRSKDATEQSAAHAFLLGVLDTTEGTVWCDYRQYKSTTLLEKIHSGLENQDDARGNERAARVITGFLKTHFPC
jgi:hypothetical protein